MDDKRLGKQRVECAQILEALLPNSTSKWKNHPAVLMWKGYENSLVTYGICVCAEWINRGFEDNMIDKITEFNTKFNALYSPRWLGWMRFHESHRAALLFKKPEYYKKFGWVEEPKIEYFWPTKNGFDEKLVEMKREELCTV